MPVIQKIQKKDLDGAVAVILSSPNVLRLVARFDTELPRTILEKVLLKPAVQDAVEQANEYPDQLELIARSDPWQIYLVSNSELVEGLKFQPNVVTTGDLGGRDWTDPAMMWFNDPTRSQVIVTAGGPDDWHRINVNEPSFLGRSSFSDPLKTELPALSVTNISEEGDTISFSVDQVGVPVLVKASYFPNWSAEGALGPYRATPNWMVVIPTDNEVALNFKATWAEYLGWLITFAGACVIVFSIRSKRQKMLT